jgi:hypothetical protein
LSFASSAAARAAKNRQKHRARSCALAHKRSRSDCIVITVMTSNASYLLSGGSRKIITSTEASGYRGRPFAPRWCWPRWAAAPPRSHWRGRRGKAGLIADGTAAIFRRRRSMAAGRAWGGVQTLARSTEPVQHSLVRQRRTGGRLRCSCWANRDTLSPKSCHSLM